MPNYLLYFGIRIYWKEQQRKLTVASLRVMKTVREGGTISLNAENIGCGGGKFYTGFTEMPERVPTFVSLKERYKQTPEMVVEFIRQIGVPKAEKKYLHFARIDKISSLEQVEGVMFIANPDMLSGLTTWLTMNIMPKMASVPYSVPVAVA